MNRPFYAFGVLLALLALAMFAVGSSSRSTTVEAPPASPEGSLKTPLARLGTIYVVVLPAAEEPVGLSEACALSAPDVSSTAITELKPILVRAADYDAVAADADCLSHYDRSYDRQVYGQRADGEQATGESGGQLDQEGDWLTLFHELPTQRPQPTLWTWPAAKLRTWKDQPIFRGLQNLVVRYAERLGWPADDGINGLAINWREYDELMDSIGGPAAIFATPIPAAAAQTVRSSDWMLHFAVSSLSQLGQTLQQAAAELQRLQFGWCDQPSE